MKSFLNRLVAVVLAKPRRDVQRDPQRPLPESGADGDAGHPELGDHLGRGDVACVHGLSESLSPLSLRPGVRRPATGSTKKTLCFVGHQLALMLMS